jgi:MGT family glycosyltransferase
MADITARGLRFNVRRLGAGERTVVFLHGLVMDNLSSWYFTLANRAAADADVILFDLRGHGRSERPPTGYKVEDMVADLAALLDALDVRRPVDLVGNSFGGLLAVAFAAAHPARTASLLLVDAHLNDGDWSAQMIGTLTLEGDARDAMIARNFHNWLGRNSARKSTRLAETAQGLLRDTSLLADLEASAVLGDDALRAIRCPVLALYGAESDSRGRGETLARLVPDCTLRLFPGCTHSVLWEATAALCEQALDWLSRPARAPCRGRQPMTRGRFLFVVPPLTGHVNPTVGVARELVARGHEVAWVGHAGAVRKRLPAGATLFELPEDASTDYVAAADERAHAARGLEALKYLWQDFLLPLARSTRAGVDAAVDAFRPTALVVDQQALAGMLVARQRGLPWATFCTTSAGVTDPLASLPRVQQWLDRQFEALQRDCGLYPLPRPDCSEHLTVVFSSLAFVGGDPARFPPAMRFVGPAAAGRPDDAGGFPWDALGSGPRVFVSLGTVNMERGERFYRVVLDALRGRDAQAVVVAPEALASEAPDNVLVRPYVPQLALLPKMDAVVCHGGHNTVCEALANALPLVVAPIRDDQPVVAQQVVDAGAGLRVRFGRVQAAELWEAIQSVLGVASFRAAAATVRDSFATAGGAPRAAELLEAL